MSKFDFIRKHLTNKTIVHASMLAFAVTSTLNVAGFFVATHHHVAVAASIGLALGAGLMAVSIYLSAQDMRNRAGFLMLLAAAICMALLSGQIQAMAYQLHGLDTFTAYLLGYAPPLVAEVLLALSVSLAERNEAERVRRDSKTHIKDSVAAAMVGAFKDIDATRIQRHIDKQVDSVVKAFVDDALGEMMAELRSNAGNGGTASVLPTATETATTNQISAFGAVTLPDANAERQRIAAERQAAITELLQSYGAMSTTELVQRLQDDRSIAASDRTVRADCATLEANGELVKAGRRWDVSRTIAELLPVASVPALNGHSH